MVEALRGQDAEFGFGQVKSAAVFRSVAPFEALNQAAGFGIPTRSPPWRRQSRPVEQKLRYLPQYSPDLNPIESVFDPLKILLRKSAERTVNGLQRRVGSFIRGLKRSEGVGYFRHGAMIHYDRDVL